ncbi:disulfide bond formation protein B [Bosea sp. (in: a-proteobacteria)]|uniref:disulfide bond formation protein B n=1 Tax=Bosea sp. (in: a-proteobacteria) TaxID=1871050 RepID=UPI002621C2B5|nr:disulfide bond formation protein B [Bosea sp. (in: a-proteobacteria)]MCO5089671.1 disulfide bond formation protein B [Bosea sp. (in: a-proteobacteria)]
MTAALPASRPLPTLRRLIALIGFVSFALVAGAWYFELVLHLLPCKLCLEQRVPHYAAIGLSLAALVLARSPRLQWLVLLGLALLMAWSTWLGVYHAGVEWGWFVGPNDCGGAAGPVSGSVQDFMKQLGTARIVACSEAAWRFLGLSLAGWNALASAGLVLIAAFGLLRGGLLRGRTA